MYERAYCPPYLAAATGNYQYFNFYKLDGLKNGILLINCVEVSIFFKKVLAIFKKNACLLVAIII